MLPADDDAAADIFAARSGIYGDDRFLSGDWSTLSTGAPVQGSALVALDFRVFETQKVSSHCVCLAREETIHEGEEGPALMYFQRRYSAPTAAIARRG